MKKQFLYRMLFSLLAIQTIKANSTLESAFKVTVTIVEIATTYAYEWVFKKKLTTEATTNPSIAEIVASQPVIIDINQQKDTLKFDLIFHALVPGLETTFLTLLGIFLFLNHLHLFLYAPLLALHL